MKTIVPSLRLLGALALLTGLVYPLLVTAVARVAFPRQAQGSLVRRDGKPIGSELLAQNFTNAIYFWPRPSGADFATLPSGASNKGPTSSDLKKLVEERAAQWRGAHRLAVDAPVPPELLLASGSGLDPHLSPAAARFQLDRVAEARGFDATRKRALSALVSRLTEPAQFGFLGEPRVNVLLLNQALDALRSAP
jgi:K+-transporting ATPase ATPase C chain